MPRRVLIFSALLGLAGAGALTPTVALADTTGSIAVTGSVQASSTTAARAQVTYTCVDPDAPDAQQPLLVSVTQYGRGTDADPTGLATDPGNLMATCDDVAHQVEVDLAVVSGALADGPARAGLFIGFGGPGDLGPITQDVTVTGLPEVDTRADVVITVNATPEPATKGKKITVKGTIERAGKAYAHKLVTLEFKEDGQTYERVKDATADAKGRVSTSVTATRTGSFRFTSTETSATKNGVSPGDHVEVKAAPKKLPKPKAYKNCSALNDVYPHGVGKKGAKDKGGSVTTFTVDDATYAKNTKSDRDKDGIACEKA